MIVKGIIVLAGHSTRHPGAIAHNGEHEHHYTRLVQQKVISLLKPYAVDVVTEDENMPLGKVIKWVNSKVKKGWIVIDIHFNNNNPAASGTEIFINQNSNQFTRKTASKMVNNLAAEQNLPLRRYMGNRDYKYPKESARGQLAVIERVLLDDSPVPVFLPEICFLNKHDMQNFNPITPARAIVGALELRARLTCQDPKTEKRV